MELTEDSGQVLGAEGLHGVLVQAVAVVGAKIPSSTMGSSLEAGVVGRQMEVVELCRTWVRPVREEVSPHPSVVVCHY